MESGLLNKILPALGTMDAYLAMSPWNTYFLAAARTFENTVSASLRKIKLHLFPVFRQIKTLSQICLVLLIPLSLIHI